MCVCVGFVWLGLGAFVVLGFRESYRDDLCFAAGCGHMFVVNRDANEPSYL